MHIGIFASYLALVTNSSTLGSLLVTIIPLFILAGSRAQFEIPMNATLSATLYTHIYHCYVKYLKPTVLTLFDLIVPSSSNG